MRDSVLSTSLSGRDNPARDIPRSRMAFLSGLFFLICFGLGYPSLNRIDWRSHPGGLDDVVTYATMVVSPPNHDLENHMQYRVLVPYLARPIYRVANGRIGTWDPIMFGLLVVNSIFVALTAVVLMLVVFHETGTYTVALGSAFVYLVNFAIPNLRLVGFIDAGEGFSLILLTWCLFRQRFWILPLLGVLGAVAKESFVPYLIVFTSAWWLASRTKIGTPGRSLGWIVASWCVALACLAALQWWLTGVYRSPLRFGLEMHRNSAYVSHFIRSLADRNLWYIFVWLFPLSLFRLRCFSRNWRFATGAAGVAAFAMDAYYGGQPGTIGRSLFSVAGPLLSASVALLLFKTPAGLDELAGMQQNLKGTV